MFFRSFFDQRKYKKILEYIARKNKSPSYESRKQIAFIMPAFEGLTGALMAFFVTGTFLSVLYYPYFWLFMGIIVARNNLSKKIIVSTNNDSTTKQAYDISTRKKNNRRNLI